VNQKTIQQVYLIGIGGIGMSSLARYFHFVGKKVAGYDRVRTPLTEALMALGIDIHYEDGVQHIPQDFLNPSTTLVIYTPAVPDTHNELAYYQEAGFEVMKRAAVLGLITRDTYCFAVAGTHGKTTTSCILAHLLKETDQQLIAFLGGVSEDFDSNFVLEGTQCAVVEADEYDRSFLHLSPDMACITSMDADHLDIYGSGEALHESFGDFVKKLKPGGKVVVRNGLPIKGISYGIADGSDFQIDNLRIEKGAYRFDIKTPLETVHNVRFHKPGKHNLLNGLAAFAMAVLAGGTPHRLAEAMQTFKGVKRRFSYQLKTDDLVFIDDYAHHPTEIMAVYEAVAEMHPQSSTMVVFQPHLYSRTQDFVDGFAKSLSHFDHVVLLEIYPAREEPIAGVTSAWLLEKIEHPNKKLIAKSAIVAEIKACAPDVLITMGAGDIGLEVERITYELAHAC